MLESPATTPLPAAERQAELKSVLDAWREATVRLQQTHEALRAEVVRLTQELEAKNRQLARKNRLADLGQIASHVAHEVRNNLVPVSLYLSLLRRRAASDAGCLDILDKIETGFLSLDAMVNDLLNFASDRDPQCQPIRLRALVDEVAASLAPQLEAQAIELDVDVPQGITLSADAAMLRRAVLNLLLNALDAMPDGGQIVVTGWEGKSGVELEIADSGQGLSEDARRRAFEPFYTTKCNGIGLGLAIVHRVIEAHGGEVSCQNCPEGGAAFTLRFPRRAWEAAA